MPPINDDYDDQDDDDQQDEKYVQLSAKDLRALRKKARTADELNPKYAAQERELAFLKAGINTDDPKMKYFVKAYEGDLSGEAVKAAAIEAGLVAPPQQQIDPEELRLHQQMAKASSGSDGDTSNEPNLLDRINSAKNPDEIMKLLTDAGVPTSWNRP
jgi:ribosomal protein L12E/L44/L45/RPP1/RPP2